MGGVTPQRLIPAHAGKTIGLDVDTDIEAAHPRSRGENTKIKRLVSFDWGSSPLTRGKLCFVHARHGAVGLIPAHAGKTWTPDPTETAATAHPRSRGENAGPLESCTCH